MAVCQELFLTRCDGKVDCTDTSDEINCNVLNLDNSYNKVMWSFLAKYKQKSFDQDISPPTVSGLLKIDLSFYMDTVLSLDEIKEEFYISFTMMTQWYDSRLKFNNLKEQVDLNVLTPSQHNSIWTPNLIFYNTKSKIKSSLQDATIRVLLNDNFTFEKADMTSSNNVYLFKGSENKLEISQVYDIYFICQYDMR